MSPADRAQEIEDAGEGRARGERPLGGALNHGPIGERIRKRHADFEHVRAGAIERAEDAAGAFEIGIAGGDVGHESRRVILAQPGRTSAEGGSFRLHYR